jgi:peroxiredoxin
MRKSLTILGLLSALLFACNPGPDGFTINVNVTGIRDGTLFYLKNWRTDAIMDSAYVLDGSFSLQGRLSHPENLLLHATDTPSKEFIYTNLLIGNENVNINATRADFPWNIDAVGSESQDMAEIFNHVEYQRQELIKLPGSNVSSISDSLHHVKVQLIKENFNSYAALTNFKYYKLHFPTAELAGLYQSLSPELKRSIYGKAIKTQIENPPPVVGGSYYDYTAVNQNGDTVSLSEIRDRYLLLHFASAACYYSQQSISELKVIQELYKDKLEIVIISVDVSKEDWEESIKQDSITWLNLWDGKAEFGDAVVKYGIIGTPNYVLISPAKIIVDKWFGYSEGMIKEKIRAHL